jgi:hypothetical protein
MRNRDHEVAAGITDQTLDLALVVTPGRTPELIGKQIVALQLQKGLRFGSLLTTQDGVPSDRSSSLGWKYPGHRDPGVSYRMRVGTAPKYSKART